MRIGSKFVPNVILIRLKSVGGEAEEFHVYMCHKKIGMAAHNFPI